ncbi:DUF4129 domain-containing protein [Solicola gregarius]|uniref:DUF4129 domain-containing protein n=1 Tax=Solicola gregarius TaxID=2908642 RepID=A0AA46TJX1_9ACTN|nr:DUF4129 domain-containing protein [Solicola gregarius]UYM06455.1 DUF4129 domain-containing protein [Solicola gregarius]
MDEGARRRLAGVLVGGLVAVGLLLAVWAASAGPSLDWSPSSGDDESTVQRTEQPETATDACRDGRCEAPERDDSGVFGVIATIILVLIGLTLLAAVIALLRAGRAGFLARRRRGGIAPPGEALPDVAAAVREDAAGQYAALRTGSPRNAIVACWVRLEDSVMSAGLTVRGSETSSELTHRILAKYGVDDAAITRLGALYREARFSRHEVTESMRTAAIDALDRVHASLERRPASGSGVPR